MATLANNIELAISGSLTLDQIVSDKIDIKVIILNVYLRSILKVNGNLRVVHH